MFGVMFSQVITTQQLVMKGQRIALMIAHKGNGMPRIRHTFYKLERFPYSRTTVNVIAHKDQLSVRVLPHSVYFGIIYLLQETF